MRLAPQIFAAYSEVSRHLFDRYNAAVDGGDAAAQSRYAEMRTLTENAYFVLLWGQIEVAIDARWRAIVEQGLGRPSWHVRRHFHHVDLARTRFEERLALLLDKQGGPGSAWALAITYYRLRNAIAHGRSDQSGVSLPNVLQDLYRIQGALASR